MAWRIREEVKQALTKEQAVVALESTVITHGLPRPDNLALARRLEEVIREAGAVPATVGMRSGDLVVGLDSGELEHLATSDAHKASLWNLAALSAQGRDAGTTVATTLHAAAQAGIEVFATGGIGGVHKTAQGAPRDESADLMALSKYPVIVVCAGAKSILDIAATKERLESLGVPLVGYQTDKLAGFHVPETAFNVPVRCDTPAEVASLFKEVRTLNLSTSLLVAKPVSEGLEAREVEAWLTQAQREADERGLSGKDVTPYLLARLGELSEMRTTEVNVKLLEENAQLAAEVARALKDGALTAKPLEVRSV